MLCRIIKVALAVSWIALLPKITWAQTSTAATVQGVGGVTLRPQPVVLRMHVKLQSGGKTAKLALAKLKTRREAALAKLQALKADPASISVANPVISEPHRRTSPAVWNPYASPDYQPRPPSVSAPRQPVPVQVPHLFVGSVRLTADWPLKADTPEELLLEAHALREKIEAADIAGTKDAETRSAEQPRVLEALPTVPVRPSYSPAATSIPKTYAQPVMPAGPSFQYVARLSAQQRKAAMAEAFDKAKGEASEWAEAVGARLGPLAELHGSACGVNRALPNRTMSMYDVPTVGPGPLPENEVGAVTPDALEFYVFVKAKFNLK